MTCPEDPLSISQKLVQFNARYTLNGELSGSVVIANPNCELGSACSPCQPIHVSVGTETAEVCGDCIGEELFSCEDSDPDWIAGIVTAYTEAGFFNDVPVVSGNVEAYSSYLNTKPINTETYALEDLAVVVSEVLSVYGGVPGAFFQNNIPVGVFTVQGPVQGNSLLAELRKLAQVGLCHVFTQVGGILTIDPWKDPSSPVDYVIPTSLIVSAEKAPVNNNKVSFVRARGAAVNRINCGEQVFTSSSVGDSYGAYSDIGGYLKSISLSGVPTPVLNISFDNLAASEEDLKNAEIESDGVDTGPIRQAKDGSFRALIAKSNGDWFNEVESDYNIMVYGTSGEKGVYTGDFIAPAAPGNLAQAYFAVNAGWSKVVRWPISPNTFTTNGADAGVNGASPTYYADQPSQERIETVIMSDSISACGVTAEQLDNPYTPSKERLFLMGVRRMQEMRMMQDSWLVETAYLPCIRLNQVVQFVPSTHEGCDENLVTGIVAGIDVDYNAKPEVRMKLVIWGFGCVGDDDYYSDNLIIRPCAGSEAASSNPWVTSALDLSSQAWVDDYCGFLFIAGNPSIAFFSVVQEEMVPGDDYTISFDYELIGGTGTLAFTHPGGLVPLSGTGTYSTTFTAGLVNFTFDWRLQGAFVPCGYSVCNIELFKTITA